MGTTDQQADRWKLIAASSALALVALILIGRYLMLPPQMGADDEVFKTVDALFTAMTSRDRERLDDCQRRLQEFRAAGTLPAAAAKDLESLIQQAQAGKWEPAARRLYDFMLAQRRST